MGDRDEERQAFQIPADEKKPVGPGSTPESSFDPTRLDFGHYAGRTIEELAAIDPAGWSGIRRASATAARSIACSAACLSRPTGTADPFIPP